MAKLKIILFLHLISLSNYNLYAESIREGQTAPGFDLPDQQGLFHNLNDYKDRWLIIYFYPKDDTPGCTTEAQNFTEKYTEFKNLNTEILGVSMDSIESHKEFAEKYNIPYPLLSDKDEIMSTAYDVVREIPFMHHSKRQSFIINPSGVIVKHYPDVSPSSHTSEVLSDLVTLQSSL
ncbi:MAG: peroxiredoxin [Gammaproteobacteria bacterium]|jgi:peroxiredoxin Q/BCP